MQRSKGAVKYFNWNYAGKEYGAKWTVGYDTYEASKNKNVDRSPYTGAERKSFLDHSSQSVKSFADHLCELSASVTDNQRANFVLKFVQQSTEHQFDSDYCGQSEYWKYPVETLFDQKGDCEDTAILYCVQMKAMMCDTAIFLYLGVRVYRRGHVAAAVVLHNVPDDTYYNIGGTHHHYCGTTSDVSNVGDGWDLYDKADVLIIN